ncbi:MAG: gamma-glutamylcyclotransferase [Acidobacteria bacterium]|nr:gamma-glutamylcyclotransferase [Acidobacteriota bacterium]
MPEYLFVYGTLRSSHDNPFARRLRAESRFAGEGETSGALYQVDPRYPGLVLDGSGMVPGEIYELQGQAELLADLDQYEGCGADDPAPHEYTRQLISVWHCDGGELLAWAYIYQWSVADKPRLPDPPAAPASVAQR